MTGTICAGCASSQETAAADASPCPILFKTSNSFELVDENIVPPANGDQAIGVRFLSCKKAKSPLVKAEFSITLISI